MHGGKNVGPKHPVWLHAGRKRYIAARHALGLKAPGGRPSGRWWKAPRDDRERLLRMLDDLIEAVPAGPLDKPIEQWSHAELLSDTARLGLMRVREVVSITIDGDSDIKWARLGAEMGLGAAKLLANVQEAAMRTASDRGWDELLARIAQAKGEKK